MKPPSRSLRAAFGILLFALLVWVAGPARLARVLGAVHVPMLLLAAAAYAAMVAVKTARWLRVLGLQGLAPALPWRHALRAYGLGMLLAAVTPGRIGQHVKALALVQRGASFRQALAGTLVDQLLDLVVVAALLPLAVFYFGLSLSGSAWMGLAALALAVAGIGVLARMSRHRFAAALAEAWRLGRRSMGMPLLLALASIGLYFVSLAAAARAVGIGVGPVTIALASIASAVVEVAPVTVAGLGTREAALLALLGPLGVEAAPVLAFTLVVRALQIAAGAIAYGVGRGRIALTAPHESGPRLE